MQLTESKPYIRPASARGTTCIYGSSGMGKSTLSAEAAYEIYKKTGLKARVVNADGGGTSVAFRALEDADIAQIWQIDTWDEKSIFHFIQQATAGWWPQDLSIPNSNLLPPWREYRICPACGGNSGASSTKAVPKCISCNTPLPVGVALPLQREYVNGFDEIGCYVFEGITSFGELFMNRVVEINPEGGNSILDMGTRISGAGLPHYNMAQNKIFNAIVTSSRLPVELVVWTALEGKGEEGKRICGPVGPGKKLAESLGAKFHHLLHLDAVKLTDPKGQVMKSADGLEQFERKLFLQAHFPSDVPGTQFMAKTSVPKGGEMPQVIPASMKTFLDLLDTANQKARACVLA